VSPKYSLSRQSILQCISINGNRQYIKNQHQFMINVGRKFEPTMKQLNNKMAGTSYADLTRWGIQISNRTAGKTSLLAHANRLGDRSITDVLSQLWKMWFKGEIELHKDADQSPGDLYLETARKAEGFRAVLEERYSSFLWPGSASFPRGRPAIANIAGVQKRVMYSDSHGQPHRR
jgi:hypothetical protein